MSRSRKLVVCALVLCGGVVGFVLWPRSMDRPATDRGKSQEGPQTHFLSNEEVAGPRDSVRRSRPNSPDPAVEEPVFENVEKLLRDATVSDARTASSLIELAGNKDVSLPERGAALSHALLLTSDEQADLLVNLASRDGLPKELASELLAGFHNRPDPWRLAGAVALARHADSTVRAEALELVRFLIGEGSEDADPKAVLDAATGKLRQMRNQ